MTKFRIAVVNRILNFRRYAEVIACTRREAIAKVYVLKDSDWERLKQYMADYMIEEMPVIMKAWQVPN